MAQFKVFRGTKSELDSVSVHDGYVYFTEDDGKLYIDTADDRVLVNTTAKSYTTTLTIEGWKPNDDNGYVYNYENSEIKCGPNGDIPPIVSYTSNLEEYSLITDAEATPGKGIDFYIEAIPAQAIDIIIVDNK